MTGRLEYARQFWCAATYSRHAPEDKRSLAITILEHVSKHASGMVKARADNRLREIHDAKSASAEI